MKNCEYLRKGISSPLMLDGRYRSSGLVFRRFDLLLSDSSTYVIKVPRAVSSVDKVFDLRLCFYFIKYCKEIPVEICVLMHIVTFPVAFYFCFFRRPASGRFVSAHLKEKCLSYLYQIWYGCLLG